MVDLLTKYCVAQYTCLTFASSTEIAVASQIPIGLTYIIDLVQAAMLSAKKQLNSFIGSCLFLAVCLGINLTLARFSCEGSTPCKTAAKLLARQLRSCLHFCNHNVLSCCHLNNRRSIRCM